MAYNEVFKKQNSEPTVATIPKPKTQVTTLPVAAVRLQGKGKDEKTRHFNVNQLDFKKKQASKQEHLTFWDTLLYFIQGFFLLCNVL